MMREAQRMMQDPQFQLQMQQMMQQQNMQQAIQTTKQTISDPHKLKQLELKTKLALADGEKKLAALETEQQRKLREPSQGDDHKNADDTKILPTKDVIESSKDYAVDDDDNHDTEKNDATAIVNDDNNHAEEDDDDIPDMPALSLN